MSDQNRYEGKPFLRLLELYVLWAILELPKDQENLLVALESNLRRTYDHLGSWHEIIADQMEFPPSFPELVRGVWEKNKLAARKEGEELTPDNFVVRFVDVNFPSDGVLPSSAANAISL